MELPLHAGYCYFKIKFPEIQNMSGASKEELSHPHSSMFEESLTDQWGQ